MINSPLARVFRGHESELPIAFEEQFLATPERTYDVVLEGVMYRIWNHPAWLKPLFVIFGRLGLLISGTGENIPFRLEVIPGSLSDGQPFHEWKRTFEFDSPAEFKNLVVYDTRWDNPADHVGPQFRLHMVWKGKFIPPRTFTLETVTYAIRIGSRVFYLPKWIWLPMFGRVELSQTARSAAEDTVDLALRIIHPFFGEVVGYEGMFQIARYKNGVRIAS